MKRRTALAMAAGAFLLGGVAHATAAGTNGDEAQFYRDMAACTNQSGTARNACQDSAMVAYANRLDPPTTTTTTVPTTASTLPPETTTTVAPTTTAAPTTTTAPPVSAFPDASTTGVPDGLVLHPCASSITATGTYDACLFDSVDIHAPNVTITRSLINGQVTGIGNSDLLGLTIEDSTIDCHCQSTSDAWTPSAIMDSNFTLRRVEITNTGHGAAVSSNVVIEDSWIHGLGGNTQAHKDAIYSGDGTNVTLRHNNIECATTACTSAIGLLTDFSNETYWTIDGNLLNDTGSYCFYAAGGPTKAYHSDHITFTNNHFGNKYHPTCGSYGPVAFWDASQPGMVWSGNVWDATGAEVLP